MNQIPESSQNKNLSFFAVPLVALLAFAAVWTAVDTLPRMHEAREGGEPQTASAFEGVDITAKAAYVYDSRTKEVLYAKNENLRLPLASVTKVMAALVAAELGTSESTVVVGEEALKATGDSGLYRDERFSLKDILDFSLTSSSNDGMRAIAASLGAVLKAEATELEREEEFVREMNRKAEDLGMDNSYFFNPTGLDESEIQGGAYGSAKDIALLFDYILRYHPALLEATQKEKVVVTSLDNREHVAENTGENISEIPGIKASKTGFTDIAGGNLVIAFDPELGRPIIVAVLGSTAKERFTDVLALVEASMRDITGEEI